MSSIPAIDALGVGAGARASYTPCMSGEPTGAAPPSAGTALLIRFATADDAASVAAIYTPNVEGSAISFEAEPPSPDAMRARITSTLQQTPWLVCEGGGELLGYAYASPHSERAAYLWSLNASVYVAAGCRRQGIGRALYASLFALARLAGYYAVHAGVTLPNAPSVGLHESLGFVPIGVYRAVGFKRGAWHDVGWWQLELRPRVGTPGVPIALPRMIVEAPFEVAVALSGRGVGLR
jgi:L-amino acid N-acyltransferase YncA